MNKHIAEFSVFLSSFFMVVIHSSLAELLRIRHDPIHADNFAFLVVGDWGREGSINQSRIAYQMGIIGENFNIEFIISTGDNFYEKGLTSIDDRKFLTSFKNVYTAKSLQKLWYIVLGNHDYMGDVAAQLHLKRKDPRWICHRSYVVNTGLVDFFFIDTTPLVNAYFYTDGFDWRGVMPDREAYVSKLVEDVTLAIKGSSARWKIVVGHHTILSAGAHGDTKDVSDYILPILVLNGVDFYINGHDHCMQRIEAATRRRNGVQFVTSGGGSLAWANRERTLTKADKKFYYDGEGFMMAQITEASVHITFYNIRGKIIHEWMTDYSLE